MSLSISVIFRSSLIKCSIISPLPGPISNILFPMKFLLNLIDMSDNFLQDQNILERDLNKT